MNVYWYGFLMGFALIPMAVATLGLVAWAIIWYDGYKLRRRLTGKPRYWWR